jgi:ribosomal-protein-alanine N-acetyltransferase
VTYPVEIRTTRLLVREFSKNDTESLFALTSNPDVVRYLEFSPTSQAQSQGLMDFATASSVSVPRQAYVLAIVDIRTAEFVGSCGLQPSDDDSQAGEVYFVFRHDRWAKGLASELVPALIDLAWKSTTFDRVYAVVHPENAASLRVLEHAGMVRDGIVPEAFPDKTSIEGRWRDGILYAILRWPSWAVSSDETPHEVRPHERRDPK